MKKILFVLAIINFVFISEFSAQNSNQTPTRQNCSYVGRPIIDIGGGIVIGKALKLPKPKLSKKAKKIAQNTSVTVNIIVDETGKVISAQADAENPLLQIPTEQAAIKSKFRVSLSSGEPIKVKMEIIYFFENNKVKIRVLPIWESVLPKQTTNENHSDYITSDPYRITRMFDSKIGEFIYKSRTEKIENFGGFIENNQANIQICLFDKTPEILERIKETGFTLLEETQGNGLVGRIPVENLEKLADIEEIKRVVPEIQ